MHFFRSEMLAGGIIQFGLCGKLLINGDGEEDICCGGEEEGESGATYLGRSARRLRKEK